MSLYSDRCLGALLGLVLALPCRRVLGKDPGQGVSCLHPGWAPLVLVHLPCPREADPEHPLVRGSHLFPQRPEAGWQRSAGEAGSPGRPSAYTGTRLTGSGPCRLGRNAQPFGFWQRHSSSVHPFCLETLPVSLANWEAEVSTSVQQGWGGRIAQRAP